MSAGAGRALRSSQVLRYPVFRIANEVRSGFGVERIEGERVCRWVGHDAGALGTVEFVLKYDGRGISVGSMS